MAVDTSLAAIQKKVRRLTRTPSEAQLSTDELNQYINTFVLYDFPEQLRLFNLHSTFTFYTQPNVSAYDTRTMESLTPGVMFDQKYLTVNPPVYVAGYQIFYSQSPEQFYGIYPKLASIAQVGAGDGSITVFSGILPATPVLQNNVLFNSIDANNNGLRLSDDGNGVLSGTGTGTIDYITGAYSLSFSTPPASGQPINSQTFVYQASMPQGMLFYDGIFTLRPVPDQVYAVSVEVYQRPTELLAGNSPMLQEWWQYIAYGAAIKVLQDRVDQETVNLLLPEFKAQEHLILRRTIVQQSNNRTATIYQQQTDGSGTYTGFWGPFW